MFNVQCSMRVDVEGRRGMNAENPTGGQVLFTQGSMISGGTLRMLNAQYSMIVDTELRMCLQVMRSHKINTWKNYDQ
jgi:hypothetical protein